MINHYFTIYSEVVLPILILWTLLPIFSLANFNLFSTASPTNHVISIYTDFDKSSKTFNRSTSLDNLFVPLGVRRLIFVGNQNISDVSRGTFRFTQPSNILIVSLDIQPVDLQVREFFKSFHLFAKVTSTLIAFLLNISIEIQTVTEKKVQSTVSKYTVGMQAVSLIIVTNSQFGSISKILTTSHLNTNILSECLLFKAINNPMKFHRLKLRYRNGNKIAMVVFSFFPEFFEPTLFGNNRNACKDILFKSPSKAYFCGSSLMFPLHIGRVHNVSVEILHVRNRTELNMAKTQFDGQYILNNKSSQLQDGPNDNNGERTKFLLQGLYFIQYSPEQLVYCQKKREHDNLFKHSIAYWIAPLYHDVVIFILLLIIAFTFISRHFKMKFGFVISLGLFFRQSQPILFLHNNCRWFLIITFFGMFTCVIYENVITSTVLVPELPKVYKSIKEILDAGYKILWYARTTFFTPESYFGKSFESRGIPFYKVKQYFETVPSHLKENVTTHGIYLAQKFALLVFTNSLNMWIRGIEQSLANVTVPGREGRLDKYSCHAVPDIIASLPFFEDFHVVNRDWMLETLERIRESGLDNKWDSWSNWAYKFHMKYDMENIGSYRKTSSYIDMDNLYAVFLCWTGLSAIAGFVCLLECASGLVIFKLHFKCIYTLTNMIKKSTITQ